MAYVAPTTPTGATTLAADLAPRRGFASGESHIDPAADVDQRQHGLCRQRLDGRVEAG